MFTERKKERHRIEKNTAVSERKPHRLAALKGMSGSFKKTLQDDFIENNQAIYHVKPLSYL